MIIQFDVNKNVFIDSLGTKLVQPVDMVITPWY